MKKLKFLLLMAFLVAFAPFTHSCAQDDAELKKTLEQLKQCAHLTDKRFPDLPTEEDIQRLENALLNPGYQLPNSLKKYHLTVGNLVFSGPEFSTINSELTSDGTFKSDLLYCIREGHEKGIPSKMPEVWIPFAKDSGSCFVCINLQTEKICYFSVTPRLRKDKKEYANLSEWIKETLLTKKLLFGK